MGSKCYGEVMRKCVFFDRDGIVNRHPGPGYVERWENFELLPEFVAVLRTVRELGFDGVIITNQQGVAKGVMSKEEVERIHANLKTLLLTIHGLDLLDIMYCPHFEGKCECRKPRPGMLLDAAKKHGIDLKSSWMIGDDRKDVEAGRLAGCRTIFVGPTEKSPEADACVPDMAGLQTQIAKLLCLS
jgi:D-glycero-D-manno-heptose 1,7-bisphosphate phosphatase